MKSRIILMAFAGGFVEVEELFFQECDLLVRRFWRLLLNQVKKK